MKTGILNFCVNRKVVWETIRARLLGKIRKKTLINLHARVFVAMHFLQLGSEIRNWTRPTEEKVFPVRTMSGRGMLGRKYSGAPLRKLRMVHINTEI